MEHRICADPKGGEAIEADTLAEAEAFATWAYEDTEPT
jgi:hypothetical protein